MYGYAARAKTFLAEAGLSEGKKSALFRLLRSTRPPHRPTGCTLARAEPHPRLEISLPGPQPTADGPARQTDWHTTPPPPPRQSQSVTAITHLPPTPLPHLTGRPHAIDTPRRRLLLLLLLLLQRTTNAAGQDKTTTKASRRRERGGQPGHEGDPRDGWWLCRAMSCLLTDVVTRLVAVTTEVNFGCPSLAPWSLGMAVTYRPSTGDWIQRIGLACACPRLGRQSTQYRSSFVLREQLRTLGGVDCSLVRWGRKGI